MSYFFDFFQTSTLWFFGMFGIVTALVVLLAVIFIIVAQFKEDDWEIEEELEELWT